MTSIQLTTILVLFVTADSAVNTKTNNFIAVDSVGDKLCPLDHRKFETPVPSLIACLALCSQTTGCESSNYHKENKLCYGCNGTTLVLETSQENLTGAVFYEQEQRLFPDGFIEIGEMVLKITKSPRLSYSEAENACAPFGTLAKVDSQSKSESLAGYLSNATDEYLHAAFWFQCRYDPIDEMWKDNDGIPVHDLRIKGHGWYSTGEDCCCIMRTQRQGIDYGTTNCSTLFGYICKYQKD